MSDTALAFKVGFIVLGFATILLALYRIGFKERMRREKKTKKRSIYASTRK